MGIEGGGQGEGVGVRWTGCVCFGGEKVQFHSNLRQLIPFPCWLRLHHAMGYQQGLDTVSLDLQLITPSKLSASVEKYTFSLGKCQTYRKIALLFLTGCRISSNVLLCLSRTPGTATRPAEQGKADHQSPDSSMSCHRSSGTSTLWTSGPQTRSQASAEDSRCTCSELT